MRADGEAIGRARSEAELREFLRRAGMADWESADLTDPALVEWRGGGAETGTFQDPEGSGEEGTVLFGGGVVVHGP
ncbi:hypothetical protein, partial [Nocardiopsis alba]|uniref:hypothetical protein n=1 Tax=Nocardiopsis alba TaxID=53437 RepID=UPI00366DF1E8